MSKYQTLLTNLIHSNSTLLGLSITVYSMAGNMVETTDPEHDLVRYFNEMKHIANQIEKVTIFTSMDSLQTPRRYFLSPTYCLGNDNYFWVAQSGSIIDHHLENKLLIKLNEMSELIRIIEREYYEQEIRDRLITLLTEIQYRDVLGDQGQEHLFFIGELLLGTGDLDFVGMASRNQEHSFTINFALGEVMKALDGKDFFIGEGALGHAVATEHNVYWENIKNTNRATVFNRYGVYPNHLFCFPIKIEGKVQLPPICRLNS